MGYYFSKTVEGNFEGVVERVREALKTEGFGVHAVPYPGRLQSRFRSSGAAGRR